MKKVHLWKNIIFLSILVIALVVAIDQIHSWNDWVSDKYELIMLAVTGVFLVGFLASWKYKSGAGAYLPLILVVGLVLSLVLSCVPWGPTETARAELNPPTYDGWTDYNISAAGRPVWRTTAVWTVQAGEYRTYEDVTIILASNLNLYGNLTLSNCTIWLTNLIDSNYQIFVGDGAGLLAYNCTFEHQGFRNSTVVEYSWLFKITENVASTDVAFINCSMRSYASTLWEGNPVAASLYTLGSANVSFYHCIINMGEMYFDATTINIVNSHFAGNKSWAIASEKLYFIAYHSITAHENDTSFLDISITDANNIFLTSVNDTYPALEGLNESYLYHPAHEAYWICFTNFTQDNSGVSNTSWEYPLLVNITYDTTWTDQDHITLKSYASREASHDRYLDDLNLTSLSWTVSEAEEDGYATTEVETDNMTVNATNASWYMRRPFHIDWGAGGFGDADALVEVDDNGSFSLDYVSLDVALPADVWWLRSSTHTVTPTLTAENPVTYSWVLKNPGGSTVGTASTSTYTPNLVRPLGAYDLTLTVTDDEGATDADAMVITIISSGSAPGSGADDDDDGLTWEGGIPSGSGTATGTASGSGTTSGSSDDYDWGESWYEVYTADWWEEAWDSGAVVVILVTSSSLVGLFYLARYMKLV